MRKLIYLWRRLKAIGARSTWGYCLRCARPWGGAGAVQPHHTWYGKKLPHSKGTYGCFPLCEECWVELGTPARRRPYYRRLFKKWVRSLTPEAAREQWEMIDRAVREEE